MNITSKLRVITFAGLCLCTSSLQAVPPPANHGVFAIWYGDKYELLNVPYIVGGQVVVQWADLDKGEGQYDFSPIGNELKKLKQLGKKATVQINGNAKPAWLFSKVPYYPEKLSVQVRDKKGTLMYWHPVHLRAYTNMLTALAGYLAQFPDRDAAIGIRLNFNAVGTEHFTLTPEAMDLGKWSIPPGAAQGPRWSPELVLAYEKAVVNTYVGQLSPYVKIFVRNSVKPEIEELYRAQFENGKLGWFHTSSEAEPRSASTENQYRRFYQDCRSGKTVGYAEPWASGWGDHGGGPDDRWCSPPQWNYWRCLIDLHCGVSYIALYANDLGVAVTGDYHSGKHQYSEIKEKRGYQREFQEAFRFAARYVGYHASPEQSPGAWVAFRENNRVLANNPKTSAKGRDLSVFTGDYNFLMERLPDKTKGVHNVGPENQRQGAWARVLPAGEMMRLKASPAFAASFKGGKIEITYLEQKEDAGNSFEVIAGPVRKNVTLGNTDRWQTISLDLPSGALRPDSEGAHVKLVAGAKPVYLHMAEIQRK